MLQKRFMKLDTSNNKKSEFANFDKNKASLKSAP